MLTRLACLFQITMAYFMCDIGAAWGRGAQLRAVQNPGVDPLLPINGRFYYRVEEKRMLATMSG
jgi:hypothetical protein